MKDTLVKAAAEGIRIYAATTTNLVGEAARRHDCYPVAAAALGRTMTGALLFAANLKNEEAITIKFDGGGALGKVVADAVPEGFVRGYVENPHVNLPLNQFGKIDVAGGVGRGGILTVTRFTGLKENSGGSVEITSGEIAEDLINYLYISEQTPSSIGLGVLVNPDLSIEAAGGFFLQPLPGVTDEILDKLENTLTKIKSVTEFITSGLDARGMIEKILEGFEVKILSETDLSFRCKCSRKRVEETLASLSKSDLQNLIDDGKAEVCCQFCGEKYLFDRPELEEIAKSR